MYGAMLGLDMWDECHSGVFTFLVVFDTLWE